MLIQINYIYFLTIICNLNLVLSLNIDTEIIINDGNSIYST